MHENYDAVYFYKDNSPAASGNWPKDVTVEHEDPTDPIIVLEVEEEWCGTTSAVDDWSEIDYVRGHP